MLTKKLEKGLIHVYTGDGKGKTTAALGQGIRTAGGGFKVLIVQFLKGDDTGELYSIEKLFPNLQLVRYGAMQQFYFQLDENQKKEVQKSVREGLTHIKKYLEEEHYNLIIMDEIMAALFNKIIDLQEVVTLLNSKPSHIEMILTGRDAPKELIDLADYVTEMKMIKHPFEKGISAREGIES